MSGQRIPSVHRLDLPWYCSLGNTVWLLDGPAQEGDEFQVFVEPDPETGEILAPEAITLSWPGCERFIVLPLSSVLAEVEA